MDARQCSFHEGTNERPSVIHRKRSPLDHLPFAFATELKSALLLPMSGGVVPKAFSSSIGKLSTPPLEFTLKKHVSPTATDSHFPFSAKHVPIKVANAPRFRFSSAYHGSCFESTILRQILVALFTADLRRSSGGRVELTNKVTNRLAHSDAKELSVAPSETAKLGFSSITSSDEDGSDASS